MNKTYSVIKLDHKEIDSESEVRYLQAIFITEDKALAETLLTYSPLPLVGCDEFPLSNEAIEVVRLNTWIETDLVYPVIEVTPHVYETKRLSNFEFLDLLVDHPQIIDKLEDIQLLINEEFYGDEEDRIKELLCFFESHEFFKEMDFQEDEETV
ncbi:TPA: hypothetical protein NKB00_000660 [Vibrio parahaemolyticus]|nr:hypothetical protein [Vibrio parahaemolyticus]